jgi:hypothetical protein
MSSQVGAVEILMTRLSLTLLLASLAATSSLAQTPPSDAPKKTALNPDERICEDIFIGTKVNRTRICATRAEWAARKQEDREAIENIQRPRACPVMNKRC